jgi:hypothetical protein
MTNAANPDFIAAVARSSVGAIVFVFIIVANCVGDATLYLAVVPLAKLTRQSRVKLVLTIGAIGSVLAAFGVTRYLTIWLGTLSVLLPPLAGPLIWHVVRVMRGRALPTERNGFTAVFWAWVIGALAGGVAEVSKVGLAPVVGIVVSLIGCGVLSLFSTNRPRAQAV